jgi:hypothetical protein
MTDKAYENIDPVTLITPNDLSKPFSELVKKAKALEMDLAPKMLVGAMLSLALEIEINRRNAPVISNPEKPDPIILYIPAIDANGHKRELKKSEQVSLLVCLNEAGWDVVQMELTDCFEITVSSLELAMV